MSLNLLMLALAFTGATVFTAVGQPHPAAAPQPPHPRIGISDTYPSTFSDWGNALLAGNGKMGIMVFGDPLNETVIYNDRGFNLARKKPRSFNEMDAATLAMIRDSCAAGNFAAADKVAATAPGWKDGGDGNRHPGFALRLSLPGDGPITLYSRTCDYRTGEIRVKWTDNRGDWERKSFVSRKDNVVVQRLAAPKGQRLTCTLRLSIDPGMHFPAGMQFVNTATTSPATAAATPTTAATPTPSVSELNLRALYPDGTGATGYEGVVRVICFGGSRTVQDSAILVSEADSILLLTRTAKYYSDCNGQWDRREIQRQLAVIPTRYETLLAGQRATHQVIYDRVTLDLNVPASDRALTNEALLSLQKATDSPIPALWERIFDAGRYYYLSASSDKTPPDLLGIWTGDCNAGWGGYYHLDANLNLQVSGGNIGAMPEAMEGYFRLNEDWKQDFETNARKLLGCRGLLAAGNSPGPTSGLMASINNYYPYQYATGEEGWLLYPFWEHYLVTGDKGFLRQRLYPLLREMGDFYEDFLQRKDSAGHFIFAGSVSPENQPSNLPVSLLNNSDFDLAGARFSLIALLQTCKILKLEQGPGQGVERWSRLLSQFPPYLVNADGALQEWSWPGLQDHYNHRHSSQLLMVWPFRAVTPEKDSGLFRAASMTLSKKDAFNYENAGHGLLHSALIAACLKNGASLGAKLLRLTKEDFYYNSLCTSHYGKHNTFCTDVCNTVPTILMEMLVASEPGEPGPGPGSATVSTAAGAASPTTPAILPVIDLLPALPAGLEKGAVSGIKCRNRVTIRHLSWDLQTHVVKGVLRSDIDQSVTLVQRQASTPGRIVHLRAGTDMPFTIRLKSLL